MWLALFDSSYELGRRHPVDHADPLDPSAARDHLVATDDVVLAPRSAPFTRTSGPIAAMRARGVSSSKTMT
jgi:hypothetical protein